MITLWNIHGGTYYVPRIWVAKSPPPPIGGFQDKLKTSEAVQCQVNRVDSVLLLIKKHGCKTVSQRCRNGNIWSLLYTDGARILF